MRIDSHPRVSLEELIEGYTGTRAELVADAGVSRMTLRRLSNPTVKTLRSVVKALGGELVLVMRTEQGEVELEV